MTLMFTCMFAKYHFMPSQAQQGSQFAMALSITTGRNTIIGVVALVTALVKYSLTIAYPDGLRGLIATCITTLVSYPLSLILQGTHVVFASP